MQFSNLWTALMSTAVLSLVIAQSTTTTISASPTPSLFPNSSREFVLKTDLKVKDDSKAHFDGLYLYSYHTGAGLSDVTFSSNPNAPKAWINYTDSNVGQLTFNLNGPYPWTLDMDYGSYQSFAGVRLDVGQGGERGFYINESGLVWNDQYQLGTNASRSEFAGWLVCDWWHGVPQLFWHIKYYNLTTLCSCAEVYLCPEYV